MAVLKYKKKDGTYATLTNISIKGVDPKQTTGDSTTDVMSQAAITTYLGQKLAVSDFEAYSGAVDTLIDGKASQGDLSALNEVVTAHTANTTVHVTSSDKTKWNLVDDKLNTSDFNTYSGNVNTTINGKVDKIEGKGLSTEDYTTAEKTKLSGIAAGAEVNVQANWNESDSTSDAYIQNKPTIGTAAAKGVSNGISNTDNLIESKHIYSGVGVTIDYVKTDNKIYLKSTSGSILASVDTTDFIKDGMVSNVEVKDVASSGTCLVITFNTDAGKDAINIPISSIFDASNYYTTGQTSGSTQISTALAGKSDTGHTHAISDITNLQTTLDGKSNTGHNHDDRYYTESELTGSSTTVVVAKANSAATAANASTVNGHTVNIDVPSNAVFTDNNTTYAAGSFITITGTNNSINVSTGATNSTVAVGNHTHDYSNVYQAKNTALDNITTASTNNWDTAYNNNHTHNNKIALDGITGSVGTMAYENANSYSSATQVNTALDGKANTATTLAGYGITDAKIENGTITLGSNSITPLTSVTIPVTSVTTSSTNGNISVNGSNVAVHGLGGAAYMNTGTTSSTVAIGNHAHSNYLTGITAANVTTALGYTPTNVHYSMVNVTGNLTNVTCPVSLSTNGEQCNVLYVNNSTPHTVTISTNYKSPDNSQINLAINANGYAEVNYLYFDGVTYVRAV